jgi:hypothetical protein
LLPIAKKHVPATPETDPLLHKLTDISGETGKAQGHRYISVVLHK